MLENFWMTLRNNIRIMRISEKQKGKFKKEQLVKKL